MARRDTGDELFDAADTTDTTDTDLDDAPVADGEANDAEFDVIEYTTPERKRDPRSGSTLRVDLCGEIIVARQPKAATVYFMNSAMSSNANTSDEWQAATQFVNAIFDGVHRHRFWERVCDKDDPLTAESLWAMMSALIERWTAAERGERVSTKLITIDPVPSPMPTLKPVRMDIDGSGRPLVFHPPKDIALGFATSALGTGANIADQAWHLSLFIDSTLSDIDGKRLSQRLASRDDPFDLEDIGEIVVKLTNHWFGGTDKAITPPNRRTRRAQASRQRSRGK